MITAVKENTLQSAIGGDVKFSHPAIIIIPYSKKR
jgi:hypothetical protein